MAELKPNGLVSANIRNNNNNATGQAAGGGELKPNGLVSANIYQGQVNKGSPIVSKDTNNDGLVDIRDLVAARRQTAASTGTTKEYNKAAAENMKNYLLSPQSVVDANTTKIVNSTTTALEKLRKGDELGEDEAKKLWDDAYKVINGGSGYTAEAKDYYANVAQYLKGYLAKYVKNINDIPPAKYWGLYGYDINGIFRAQELNKKISDIQAEKQREALEKYKELSGSTKLSEKDFDEITDKLISEKNARERAKYEEENKFRKENNPLAKSEPFKPLTAKDILLKDFTYYTGKTTNTIYSGINVETGTGSYTRMVPEYQVEGLFEYLTEGQAKDALYIFEKTYAEKGKAEAQKAVREYLNQDIVKLNMGNQKYAAEMAKAKSDFGEHSFLEKVGLNAYTVAYNVVGKPLASLRVIKDQIIGVYDPFQNINISKEKQNYIRSFQTDEIKDAIRGNGGSNTANLLAEAADFTYNAGMMAIDNVVGYYLYGGSATTLSFEVLGGIGFAIMPYTVTMGLGAYGDSVNQGYRKGLDKGQIISLAVISGLAETLTEGFGMEAFSDVVFRRSGNFLKSAVAEASEEVVGNLINDTADILIAGDKSEFIQSVEMYKSEGLTEAQAVGRTVFDLGVEYGKEALTAAFSVYMGGAPGAIQSNTVYIQLGQKVNKQNNAIKLRDIALSFPQDSNAYIIAKRLQNKTKLSDREAGEILVALKQELNERINGKVIESIENRLKELGVEDAENKAQIIWEMMNLEEVSESDKANILNDEKTRTVYEQMTTEHTAEEQESEELNWITDMFKATETDRAAKISIDIAAVDALPDDIVSRLTSLLSPTDVSETKAEQAANETASAELAETEAVDEESVSNPEVAEEMIEQEKSASGFEEVSVEPLTVKTTDLTGRETTTTNTRAYTAKQRTVRDIGKVLGITVTFDNVDNADGYYVKDSNHIVLDYNTVDPIRTVMMHEMTHFGQNNTKLWDNFVKAVRKSSVFSEWIKSGYRYNSYENYETAKNTRYVSQKADIILKDITEHYGENGVELSPEDAEYEMYAKFCGECLFTTEKDQEKALASILEKASAEERTSISDFIKKFVEWIKSKLPNYAPTLEQLESKWLELVKDTEVSEKENTADNSGVRYSLSPNARADVKKALNNKNYTEDVYLTETSPSIIASQKGVKNLPMLMKASHIKENIFTEDEAKERGLKVDKNTNYHGLGKTLFLKIIDGLDDVTLAYRGTPNADNTSRRENYFLLISQYKDKNGDTINVPVYINEKGQYNEVFIDTNKIATAFGRKNFNEYIRREIEKGNLVRVKNRSTQASELAAPIADSYSENASTDIIRNKPETVKENFDEGERQYSIPSENVRHNQERYLKWLYKKWGLTDYSEAELKADIKDLRHAVALYNKGGQYREEARGIIEGLAEKALKRYERIRISDDAKEVRKVLRSTTFRLSETQKQEAEYIYGSVSKFAKATGLKISDKAPMSLDSQWQEWMEIYPEYFADINEGDMIERVATVIDNLSNMTENDYYDPEEALAYNVPEMTNQIIYDLENSGEFVIKKYKQKTKEKNIGKTKTEVRNQIKELHKKIDRINTSPTNNSYIPQDLKKAVLDLLSAVDVRNGKTNKTQEKLTALYDKYERLKKNEDLKAAYDEDIALEIQDLRDLLEEKNIYDEDLTLPMLRQIYRHIRSIYGMIMDAKRLIGENERLTIQEAGKDIIYEQDEINQNISERNKVKEWLAGVENASSFFYLNPIRAVMKMSGYKENTTLFRMFFALNQGLQKSYDIQMKLNKKLDALVKTKEGRKAFENARTKKIKFSWGELTKMQAAQILLTLDRETAIGTKHIMTGGMTITDSKYVNDIEKRRSRAKTIQPGKFADLKFVIDIYDLVEKDEWLKKYIDVCKDILHNDTKKEINETSEILLHRDIATGEYYIPFITNPDFTEQEIEGVVRDATIANSGRTKEVQKGAGNALYIEGLDIVVKDAIDFTAKYAGLAVPIRNINKVLNYKNDVAGQSVKNSIKSNWGEQGYDLITQAISDLQTSRQNDCLKIVDTLKSLFITSTLAGNISVSIKQAASLFTAFSILDYRDPATVWIKFARTVKNYDKITSEIDEHTSEHWRRRIGLSTDEIAAAQQNTGFMGKLNKLPTAINGLKWIQAIDCFTTATFWDMAKQDIAKLIEKGELDAEIGDKVYWAEVTDLYERTIEETQPMYDPLHRAEMQKNAVSSKIFMFKTQPLQNAGLMYSDIQALAAAKETGDKQLINERAHNLVKTIVSQTESTITFALMTLVAAVLMGKMKRYKDDDKELTLASILGVVGEDALKTGIGIFAPVGGSELADFYFALRTKNGFQKELLSIPLHEWFNKYVNGITNLIKKPSLESISDMVAMLGDLSGLPVSNYRNIGRSILWYIEDVTNGDFGDFVAGDPEAKEKAKLIRRIIAASEKGNKEKKDHLIKQFKKLYPNKDVYQEIRYRYTSDKEFSKEIEKAIQKSAKAYSKLDEDQKKNVVSSVKGYYATENAIKVKGLDKADFDNLYAAKREGKYSFNEAKKKLLKKYSETEIEQGLKYAKVRYMRKLGISVEEYYASKKYADNYDRDKNGKVQTWEKREALQKLGLTQKQIEAFLN